MSCLFPFGFDHIIMLVVFGLTLNAWRLVDFGCQLIVQLVLARALFGPLNDAKL